MMNVGINFNGKARETMMKTYGNNLYDHSNLGPRDAVDNQRQTNTFKSNIAFDKSDHVGTIENK